MCLLPRLILAFVMHFGELSMLRQGGRNQHFSLNEAVTLSQEQECQLGLKPDWTLSWKMYLGRHPLQKLKGSVKDILQRLC